MSHRLTFTYKDSDVALRLGQSQGTLQRRERQGDVTLRLVSERLQHQVLDHATHPSTFFRYFQEALQQSRCFENGAVCTVALIPGDEHPGQREVLKLAQVAEFVVRGQTPLTHAIQRFGQPALQQLARDPRFVGGQIGMIGVLHTLRAEPQGEAWARDLSYHPHVHYLVPGGGLAPDGQAWLPSRQDFLVHVKPLGRLFRAKFRDALKKTDLFDMVPAETWTKAWVVHCQPVGSGVTALKYLAPYIFRVAISNNRILKLSNDEVTFRYKDSDTGTSQYCTVTAEKFIRRFLQHVLPKGFVKVRYYGFFSPTHRHLLNQVRQLFERQIATRPPDEAEARPAAKPKTNPSVPDQAHRCPQCGRVMRLIETLKPQRRRLP